MNDVIEKIREDRKFFFSLFAFIVFALFCAFSKLTGELFVYAGLGALGGYCAFNVAQKVGLSLAESSKIQGVKLDDK